MLFEAIRDRAEDDAFVFVLLSQVGCGDRVAIDRTHAAGKVDAFTENEFWKPFVG